jgi:hypothetical protein
MTPTLYAHINKIKFFKKKGKGNNKSQFKKNFLNDIGTQLQQNMLLSLLNYGSNNLLDMQKTFLLRMFFPN